MGFVANLFKGPPKVPDPRDIAEAQGEVSRDMALLNASLNRVDQDTPFGSIRYFQTGTDAQGNPTYGSTTQLTDEQQAILNQLQANQTQLGQTAQDLIHNTSSIYGNPLDLPDVPDFFSGAQPVVTQAMDRQLAYMQPYFDKQIENLQTDLLNKGLTPGNPAYDAEIRRLRQTQSESVGQFLNQFQSQAFNQQVRQHELTSGQALEEYTRPLDVLRAIMGIAGSPGSPTFTPVSPVSAATPDITKAFMDQFNALNQQYQQGWGALGSIGSAIMGLPVGAAAPTTVGGQVGAGLSSILGLV